MTASLVSPILVGRRAESEVLAAALGRTLGGQPTAVLVGGCVELDGGGIPFAPLVDMLRALAPTLACALALAVLAGGGMVVGEVLSETALPRLLADDVLARAYGLVLPAAVGGIAAGSLLAGPAVSLLGLNGALAAAGATVLAGAALPLRRPLAVAPVAAVA